MKYGVHLFATETSIQPGELARAAEERGFESVWFSEHSHIPEEFLESEDGKTLPDYYWQAYDPFIAATQAALAADNIHIGTGISLFLQHDPITLAKTVATLDQISGGRFLFGVGTGWNVPEMRDHGIAYASRYRMGGEYLQAMKILWTEDEPEFQGRYVNFSRSRVYPKPIQKAHPPVISGGGAGPKSLAFIARHCDGWMPILGLPDWRTIQEALPELRRQTEMNGRPPDSIELSVFSWNLPDEHTTTELEERGFQSINISLGGRERGEAIALMDQIAGRIP
jgi:probable F420-dependent oxidoreductase